MDLRRAVGAAAGRVRVGAWPALQCGLASAAAWSFAVHVLGHDRPFFAAVAAVVALGVSGGGRLTRTAELAVGVALGVLIGDLLVEVIGQGAWQIGVVVTVALVIALAVGATGLAVIQAGLQAVFVVALPRTAGSGFHRWQDALVGGGAALLVVALLPADPWSGAREREKHYLVTLADVLRETARGIREASRLDIADALARGRTLEPELVRWKDALAAGRETARITPLRRTRPEEWAAMDRLAGSLTMGTRNLRVGIRRALTAVEMQQRVAPALPGLLDELADVVERLADAEHARPLLVALARRLDPDRLGAGSLADQVLVGQLRVVVVDLLEALGMDHAAARAALPELAS